MFYNIPILLELNKIGHSRKKIKELDKTGLQGLAEGYVNSQTTNFSKKFTDLKDTLGNLIIPQ